MDDSSSEKMEVIESGFMRNNGNNMFISGGKFCWEI
jgi:hypothetical protein